jgi:PAS domain-containing protein
VKTVCAWCRSDLTPDDGAGGPVSHGVCTDCAAFLRANMPGRTLRSFLDSLPVPVLVLEADARVSISNMAARRLLGRTSAEEVEGRLGGDALECAYARLPGGCGQTVHCKACTIRGSVMHTYATGESLDRVTAHQVLGGAGGPRRQAFLIATEKRGDVVLLRIDAVGESTE